MVGGKYLEMDFDEINKGNFGKRIYEPLILYSMVNIVETLPCRVILQF